MAYSRRRAVAIALLLPLAGCDAECENTILSEYRSPDGSHVAVIFQRECGATTGFSTQLSILAPGEQPREAGNVFRADADGGRAPTGAHGGPVVEVRWLSRDTLEVRPGPGVRVFAAESQRRGVQVIYRDRDT